MSYANDMLESLILDGSVEISGMTESGEITYNFTPELKTQHPDIFDKVIMLFHAGINSLWQKGFLKIDMTLADPDVYLNEEALTPENIGKLDEGERMLLESVIRQFQGNS